VEFILVATQPLQIMTDGAVDVALSRETLLPVVFAVFFSALFEVLRYLKEHICKSVKRVRKVSKCEIEIVDIAVILETTDVVEDGIAINHECYNPQRHQVTASFALLDVPDSTGAELGSGAAVTDVGFFSSSAGDLEVPTVYTANCVTVIRFVNKHAAFNPVGTQIVNDITTIHFGMILQILFQTSPKTKTFRY
jgi:hypothetical protein